MKKILGILALLLIEVTSYSKIEENIAIEVVGEVLSAISINNKQDLIFGDVAVGMRKESEAILQITGSPGDKVKLEWKGIDGKYKPINEEIEVKMKKGTEAVPAIIRLKEGKSDEITLNTKEQEVKFTGIIIETPDVSPGKYEGTFTVRFIAMD